MILLDFLSIALAAFALYRVNELRNQTNARLTRLEASKPEPVKPKEPERVVRQVFEKPVVPGAKDVQPLPIGGGKLKFDNENQIAEWV